LFLLISAYGVFYYFLYCDVGSKSFLPLGFLE